MSDSGSGNDADSDEGGSHDLGSEGPDADANASTAGVGAQLWRRLVAAVEWVADTFRGHSRAGQLRDREK